MERQVIETINTHVYRSFPDFQGVKPSLSERPGNQTLLTYKSTATTADGKKIQRAVRVVVDSVGKILKMTTSH
jgi:hypothetical protein